MSFHMLCMVFYQGPYQTIRYEIIGDDFVSTYFSMDEDSGEMTVKRDLRETKIEIFTVSNLIIFKIGSYYQIRRCVWSREIDQSDSIFLDLMPDQTKIWLFEPSLILHFNLNSSRTGIVFIRQNLTSIDLRLWRIKTVPARNWNIDSGRRPITYVFIWSKNS